MNMGAGIGFPIAPSGARPTAAIWTAALVVKPELAQLWLDECQGLNRPLSHHVTTRYGRSMIDGEWEMTGQPLIFSNRRPTPRLLDGQHRLKICVESGKSFKTLIVAGVQDGDDVMGAIIEGMVRTAGQVLTMAGFRYPKTAAGMSATVYRYYHGLPASARVDNVALLHTIKERPEILSYCHLQPDISHLFKRFPSTMYMSVHYLFTLADEKKAQRFTDSFMTAVHLELGNPVLALRNLAVTRAQDEGNASQGYWYFRIAKCWNAYYVEEELRSVASQGKKEPTWLDMEGVPRKIPGAFSDLPIT